MIARTFLSNALRKILGFLSMQERIPVMSFGESDNILEAIIEISTCIHDIFYTFTNYGIS